MVSQGLQDQSKAQKISALLLVLSLLNLIPLWAVKVPPMQDMWQHLALVDVIHNYDSPGSIYKDFFVLPSAPRPNLLYYYLTHLLAYLAPSLEVANKLVLSLYLVTFPASFALLLDAFGRPRWLALFCLPLTYNAFFFYGFVSFLLGIPVVFTGLAAYRKFTDSKGEDLRLLALSALMMVLAYFTHAHSYLLLCMLCGILWLLHGGGRLLRLLPFLPSLSFFIPWFVVFFVHKTPSSTGKAFGSALDFFGSTYYSPSQVLSSFYRFVGDHFRDNIDDALFLSWVFLLAFLLIFRQWRREPQQGLAKAIDFEVLTLVTGLSVLALPEHIESQSIVSQRHVYFAVLFLVGWVGFHNLPKGIKAFAVSAIALLQIATVANLTRGFLAFEKEFDGYPSLFERAHGGGTLLRVTYNQESAVVPYGAYWHTQFFYTFLKGGISDMQFAEYPHNPIQYRPGMVPPKPPAEFWKSPVWQYFDYVLIRRGSSPNLEPVEDKLEPIAEVPQWVLYRVCGSPLPRPLDREPVPSLRRGLPKAHSGVRKLWDLREVLGPQTDKVEGQRTVAPGSD